MHPSSPSSPPIVIIGGGLAGLACATRLHEAGKDFILLEGSDAVGGRVRTDHCEGFLLDRGFQVFLSAYPIASKLLDLSALKLHRFRPGACVRLSGNWHRLMDPVRCPSSAIETIRQPIGTIRDKLLVAMLALRCRIQRHSGPDRSTETFLREFGFSESMIDHFFRAFYGGIFLERDLRTSSHMFEFTFQMFTKGYATLPDMGMQAIPEQLAARLPSSHIRLHARAHQLEGTTVHLENGERMDASHVVIATDASTAQRLCPELVCQISAWKAVQNLYFRAEKSPMSEAIIALQGDHTGLIHNVCVPSDVNPRYAPAGSSLVSVSVLGNCHQPELVSAVQEELSTWFGPEAKTWDHLKTYHIAHALPEQLPTSSSQNQPKIVSSRNVIITGDHCATASIEGALTSGIQAANHLIQRPHQGPL